MAREQEQFLDVVDRDTAEQRWHAAIKPARLAAETVALADALGRILSDDVHAEVDVPPFDRSNVDGFALRAEATFGASEEVPRALDINAEEIAAGRLPATVVRPETATAIATGGMLPRGADSVLMVEHARMDDNVLLVLRPVSPGANVSFAGTDISRGELLLREGTLLTSRETGMLAAVGRDSVSVVRRPRVTILSTGDEVVEPGRPLPPAAIYDANATLLADAVRELGATAIQGGVIGDDAQALESALMLALEHSDLVILSGGTSKGAGDLSFRTLAARSPGIVVHGVALKPGKPVCLGAVGRVPVAVLPGFPTSAIFTFHEFVAPVLRTLAGRHEQGRALADATMAVRSNSERGRTEFLLVGLLPGPTGPRAFPMGKGSGSVTTFSRADGFIKMDKDQEFVDVDEPVSVRLLGRGLEPADLVVIGSHCVGLDWLIGLVAREGYRCKTIWIGSQGGLDAVAQGACDVAGIHLIDPATGLYNQPFLPPGVSLIKGYGRMQGLVSRSEDQRFASETIEACVDRACSDPDVFLVNRNRGSGTRVLIDRLLNGRKPSGHAVEVRSHNAVAASILQRRADWGVAIEPVTRSYGLSFRPLCEEQFDLAVAEDRWDRPAVQLLRDLLRRPETQQGLLARGFLRNPEVSA